MFEQKRRPTPFLLVAGLILFLLLLTSCGLEWDDISFERREYLDPNDFQATRIAEALAPTQTFEAEQAVLTANALVVVLTPTITPPPPPEVIERFIPLYQDTPVDGWIVKADGAELNFVDEPAIGDASIQVQVVAPQGAVSLETNGEVISASQYDEVRFELNGDVGGQVLTFNLIYEDGSLSAPFVLDPLATRWEEIRVPIQSFERPGNNDYLGLMWRDAQGGAVSPFYIDNIEMVVIGE